MLVLYVNMNNLLIIFELSNRDLLDLPQGYTILEHVPNFTNTGTHFTKNLCMSYVIMIYVMTVQVKRVISSPASRASCPVQLQDREVFG